MKKNIIFPEVSIVIVHYGRKNELVECLESIKTIVQNSKNIECILVDNNDTEKVGSLVNKKYPFIKYLSPKKNLGWGGGRNFGIRNSSGKYIFSLDSDVVIDKKSFDKLLVFIKKNKKVAIVSPILVNKSGSFHGNASLELTPKRGIFFLSFLNKIFPNKPIVNKYLMKDWDRKSTKEVEVVQLAAFFIKRRSYDSVGGFDEKIFLYFEENDISNSLRKAGWKLFLLSTSTSTHLESKGTKKSTKEIKDVFAKSRFYYFKKHYGLLKALAVEAFARMSKELFILLIILLIGLLLRFYRFYPNLIFNGEMGTDYINVWNMLHGDRTWLIGPRTSHEWFFIPPLAYWTYAGVMLIGKMSPISINIFWGIVGGLAILASFHYIKKLFNSRIALISSFLIAVSPAWITQTRDARYNLAVSILFLPYLYYLRESIIDKGKSLLKLGLVLGIMMSFFPSPLILIPAVVASFAFFKVKPKLKQIGSFILGFLIPNITFFIYEIGNKFEITTKLLTWIPYRILGFFGLYPKNTVDSLVLSQNTASIYKFVSSLFSLKIGMMAGSLFILLTIGLVYFSWKNYKNKKEETSYFLLVIDLLICSIGLFIHGNPPSHYYYTIYAVPLISGAYFLVKLFRSKILLWTSVLAVGGICISSLIADNWFFQDRLPVDYQIRPVPYTTQLKLVDSIIQMSQGESFNLKRVGINDNFENNFANNYIYLLLTKGVKVDPNSKNTYTIVEDTDRVFVYKENQ